MLKYRIYLNGEDMPLHNETYLEFPIKITIGETITYLAVIYKVIDVIHHLNDDLIITDLHVKKNN